MVFNCSMVFHKRWWNMSHCWGILQPSGLAAREHKTLSPVWPFVKSVAPVTLLVFTGSCTYMWLKIAYHWLKWCWGWHYQFLQLEVAHSFWSRMFFLVCFSSFPSPYHLKFSSKEIHLLHFRVAFSCSIPFVFFHPCFLPTLQSLCLSLPCSFLPILLYVYSDLNILYSLPWSILMCISPSVCLWGSLFKLSGHFSDSS